MKRYIYLFSILTIILVASCSRDYLDRTIFIPDPDDSRLPAYTEWGYNSFGAIHERNAIVSAFHIVPCKILYKNGLLHFSLIGEQGWFHDVALHFSFPLETVSSIEDLSVLHRKTINLMDEGSSFQFEMNGELEDIEVRSGELQFRRFQLLRVDGKVDRIILSGTFEVRFVRNGRPESISNGRFDMGITDRDFLGQ